MVDFDACCACIFLDGPSSYNDLTMHIQPVLSLLLNIDNMRQ
jgi:hypothetical protein